MKKSFIETRPRIQLTKSRSNEDINSPLTVLSKIQPPASMPKNFSHRSAERVLEPIDRVSEILFG